MKKYDLEHQDDGALSECADGEYYLCSDVDSSEAQWTAINKVQLARIAMLESKLLDAIECTAMWGAYASAYFQEKHDLAGDLKRLKSAL
jgi:hypothetical protein